jgi:hypothetical protein
MKTDDFIGLLATGVAPVDRHALAKRFGVAVLVALLLSTLLMMAVFGIRSDLGEVMQTPIFWAKVALALCLVIGAWRVLSRLARPGVSPGAGTLLLVAAVAAVWAGTADVLINTAPGQRGAIILGKTWKTCALNIGLLSIPGFIALFWALRGLAPTRLRLTGACGGLLAGALATLVYCLHCPEMDIPFWGVWYLLGMLVPSAIGALLGPRWLRW